MSTRRAERDPHHGRAAALPRRGDDSGLGQGQRRAGRNAGWEADARQHAGWEADAREKHAARGAVQTQEEQRQVRGTATAVRTSLENGRALPVCAV